MPRQLNILVVEDSEDDFILITRYLSKAGFHHVFKRVTTESEFEKSLAEEVWDVVLADYSLPEITCARAIEILATSSRDIPFICVSGTAKEEVILSMVRAGAHDDVMKNNLARLPFAILREIGAAEVRKQHRSVEAQLQQAMKMEAIGRLASGVAHDFNNLLTVITGFAQLALLDENPARAGLEQILSAAERAAGLTRQLLAFSRQQALVTKVFDVNALVRGMEKMLGRLIGEDVRVLTHLDPEPVTVKADPGQIEQVILNLAINSRDAMPDGGQLIITTARLQLCEMAAAAVGLEAATYHTLSVSDSGSGIPADVLPLIFEPFYTTKSEGRGTGLGLSTSYGIVKQSGGVLAVTSEPGLGTTMTIYLPAASSAMLPERAQNEIVETGSETVLLTEDDHSVLRLMEESLSARGFRVLTSDSAAQGLEILGKQPPGEVAILITDIVMPGMAGPLYAEKARQIQPGLKVLFASGYSRDVIQYHGLEEGTADFIQKPFAPGELVNKVRRLLDTGLKVRGVGSGSL